MDQKKILHTIKRHHSMPVTFSGQRHLGLVLSTLGWFLIAFITVLLKENVSLYGSKGSTNFFFFHLSVLIVFFTFGIPYGRQFFICNNKKLIILRGILGVGSFWAYTFAKTWSEQVDHALLFSIDPLWAVLLLLIANYKLNKLSWAGIVVSLIGVGIIYTHSMTSWTDLQGCGFGLTSGFAMAALILITYSLIKTDHPSRIGFYHGVIGCLFSLLLLFYYHTTNSLELPSLREITIALFLGTTFSFALFCFLQSAFYAEPYVIGVTGYSLIVFTEVLHWILNHQLLPLTTMFGTALVIFGGIKVVLGSYFTEEKKRWEN